MNGIPLIRIPYTHLKEIKIEDLILENEDHAEFYNEIESQREEDDKIMKGDR